MLDDSQFPSFGAVGPIKIPVWDTSQKAKDIPEIKEPEVIPVQKKVFKPVEGSKKGKLYKINKDQLEDFRVYCSTSDSGFYA
jgi:hypothetical protein